MIYDDHIIVIEDCWWKSVNKKLIRQTNGCGEQRHGCETLPPLILTLLSKTLGIVKFYGNADVLKGPFIATQLNSTSSWVELRRRSVYSDPATQLDVELSSVELSCVAINGTIVPIQQEAQLSQRGCVMFCVYNSFICYCFRATGRWIRYKGSLTVIGNGTIQ